ncbi:MAG: hypothetical protein HN341_14270 [Verrucomicrobia bacterium]|nr:hypothetical protein [Verrucomicrobiota bacterium]
MLRCEKPERSVLFEFVIDRHVSQALLGDAYIEDDSTLAGCRNSNNTFAAAGYDHATLPVWDLDVLTFEAGSTTRRRPYR